MISQSNDMKPGSDVASILVIEDEPDLREGLRHNLELDGYQVGVAATGREGLQKAVTGDYSLIILDLMLPELSGIEVLRQLRENGNSTPVIILSAKGQDHDKVSGLEHGYILPCRRQLPLTWMIRRHSGTRI